MPGVASGRAVLATQAAGQGDPLVFLHANVCDSRMWSAQMAALAATHRVIAYDRRGFGGTRAEAEDFSPVADLMAVIEALGEGRPLVLVGCSQGGRIAIDAALRHPARIRGLVLIAPSLGGAPEPAYPPAIRAMLDRQRAAEAVGDLDAVNALKARLWLDGPLAAEGRVAGPMRDLFLEMNGIALRSPSLGQSLDTAPAFGRLHELRMPALVAWGELDFPHIQDRCRQMAAAMPAATAQALPGAAHLPSLEQPAIITDLLQTFVQRLDG
ncbi:alpha/beta fold hydrolase [Falsiroseomonas tokyonensis]|uniref:Alpha/beta fold hydrolase n=1 Tax=Falsiroseomonas tokyonensis TaxID=430521 RepID=A0ABV7BSZ0_9PROT|nr:alpha/beta hydrolase [Falsiroseomonas tokyonensis]MBU8537566.1 alpha/beta hydrolase [Falsiroseomonas tokyonensis]